MKTFIYKSVESLEANLSIRVYSVVDNLPILIAVREFDKNFWSGIEQSVKIIVAEDERVSVDKLDCLLTENVIRIIEI